MKRATIILAALLAACSTSEETTTLVADGVARFSSDISTRVSTDLSDKSSSWEAGDKIGIYMSGTASSSNVQYVAQKSATTTDFAVAEGAEGIIYPNSGTVNFVAYSPYSADVSGDEITIDVSDQSSEAARNACDFMVSTNAVDKSYSDSGSAVALSFDHKMAMLVFEVTTKDSMSDLTDLAVKITSGLTATQSYSVLTGLVTGLVDNSSAPENEIKMCVEVGVSGETATVTAIIHPETVYDGMDLQFTANGMAVIAASNGYAYAAGNIYKYEVTIGNDYVDISEVCDITAWVGNNSSDSFATDTTYTEQDIVYNETNEDYKYYEIYTAAGFKEFATKVASGTSVNGLLMADIDLGGSTNAWTPMGTYNNAYTGTFDGGNHLISGLYINNTSADEQGLFAYIGSGGVVKNLGVSGEVTASANVGGIAGEVTNGSLLNCYNMATITGSSHIVGGVAGKCQGVTIMNCYNTGAVKSSINSVGGIVGDLQNSGTVKNCYNMGAVTGSIDFVGGVVGYMYSSTISNCYSSGVVTANGDTDSGGVVGFTQGGTSNCYWADDVGSDVTVGVSVGSGATAMSAEEMKTAAFATTLNGNVSGDMFSWDQYRYINGGYPTLVVE
ncbi:MAG: fimbrillin family protein [Rikenellaceae bacterium]